MLTLRKKQIEAIAAPMRHTFELELVAHLKRTFREQCEAMDDDSILEIARYGMTRAAKYSFDTDGQIRRWLNLMFTFGRDFDTDSRFRWVQKALRHGGNLPDRKMSRLYSDGLKRENKGRGLYAQTKQGGTGESRRQ